MNKLKTALAFGGLLSASNIDQLSMLFKRRTLKAEEYVQEFHAMVKEIAFIQQGTLRVYGVDTNGNEVTKCFIRENQFFANLESYYSGQPTFDAVQAVIPTEIYTIPFSVFERQYEQIPNLFIFSKTLAEMTLLNGIKDNDFLNFGDAKTKYAAFLQRYPQLAQQVPQQYIASYLKITPQSLSRIRNRLAKQK
jgi:CRP-like cAMP-binding protein